MFVCTHTHTHTHTLARMGFWVGYVFHTRWHNGWQKHPCEETFLKAPTFCTGHTFRLLRPGRSFEQEYILLGI